MHELSIANSILNIVLEEKKVKNLPQIKAIVLLIGALSGILPDAL
jgi:Zn finger protein HypA/HybF involved in hydrogenase expression